MTSESGKLQRPRYLKDAHPKMFPADLYASTVFVSSEKARELIECGLAEGSRGCNPCYVTDEMRGVPSRCILSIFRQK